MPRFHLGFLICISSLRGSTPQRSSAGFHDHLLGDCPCTIIICNEWLKRQKNGLNFPIDGDSGARPISTLNWLFLREWLDAGTDLQARGWNRFWKRFAHASAQCLFRGRRRDRLLLRDGFDAIRRHDRRRSTYLQCFEHLERGTRLVCLNRLVSRWHEMCVID